MNRGVYRGTARRWQRKAVALPWTPWAFFFGLRQLCCRFGFSGRTPRSRETLWRFEVFMLPKRQQSCRSPKGNELPPYIPARIGVGVLHEHGRCSPIAGIAAVLWFYFIPAAA